MGVTYTVKSYSSLCKELQFPSCRHLSYRFKKSSNIVMMGKMKIILGVALLGLAVQVALGQQGDCVPGSQAACEAVAQSQGLTLGGCGFNFEGEEGYAPGCYAYNSGSCEGSAFYGTGGTEEDKLDPTIPQSDAYGTRYRPSGYDCAEGSSALPSAKDQASAAIEATKAAIAAAKWAEKLKTFPNAECTFRNSDGTPKTTDIDDVLECADGTQCNGDKEGWACCDGNGGRAVCPPNWPNMCASPSGSPSGTDYSCQKNCKEIHDGNRPCKCTFQETTDVDDMFRCMDGTTCMGDHKAGIWDCCDPNGGRAMCPPNWPVMCANPVGSPAGTDYACWDTAAKCDEGGRGGERKCEN